ncbi:hypothetical protein ABZ383_33795 [Streptomyces sp. NPDC005900]|uniref:hypothetical protein n=1 Tax=Streptomyces sp. NPDC005900 TaxID=3154569 RepID=UPI0033DA065F
MSTPSAKEPHYTKVAEWVSECGANGMETAIYQHLAKRLHHASGSRRVDPSRARLANDIGLKKADDVDPYLRALAVLGAIVIHAKKGMRTTYELPLWPPDGYDGPLNTFAADKWQREDPAAYKAWRLKRRALVDAAEAPYTAKKRARVAKTTARKQAKIDPDVPVATGRSEMDDVPVAAGRYQPVVTGTHRPATTGTNQDGPNDQTNMGDGRRPSTGSSGEGGGGSAASGKTEPLPHKAPPSSIRAVLETIPAPLVLLLEKDWPRGLPAEVTELVEQALTGEQRTVEQLGERIARRWQRFGYEDALLSDEGAGLRRALGVLGELLSPSKCWGNNLHCEDGVDLHTGMPCPRCEEERQARRPESGDAGHPEVDESAETYTAPAYVPPARDGVVGVNRDLARQAREANLAARGKVRR